MKRNLIFILLIVNTSFIFALPQFSKIKTVSCGKQPKQVLYSYDKKYLVLPLLDDTGFEVFTCDATKKIKISPPMAEKKGFAEGLFIEEKKAFFVSQMTTGNIYEYSYNPKADITQAFTYRRTINTQGQWSKFIAWSKEKNMLAVSNWISNDVSLIDYESGNVIKKIKTGLAPRGLNFINGGKEIIVLCFDSGEIQKFDTLTASKINEIKIEKAAMRHIAVTQEETFAFVSDMYHACIYKINLASFTICAKWKVFNNPNTIALLQNKYVLVSSRGPNNPLSYTQRSPVNGKISLLDCSDGRLIQSIEGGNQPTGLALSPDQSELAFTNFQDANFVILSINESLP